MLAASSRIPRVLRKSQDEYATLLRECGRLGSLSQVKALEETMARDGYGGDRFLGNLLVQMYGKCGCIDGSLAAFQSIEARNEYSWTLLVTAYAHNGHLVEAGDAFDKMPQANAIAWTMMVAALGTSGHLQRAKRLFDRTQERDAVSWNAMIAAYCQNGSPHQALELFCFMDLEGVAPSEVTFITTADACSSLGDPHISGLLHACVRDSVGQPGVSLDTAVVQMYGSSGCIQRAKLVFDGMQERNLVSWNTMISALARNSMCEEAGQLFQKMCLEGIRGDQVTLSSLLDAVSAMKRCTASLLINLLAEELFDHKDLVLLTALINMHGECGQVEQARRCFDQILPSQRDLVSWNAMLAVYGKNGRSWECLELFWLMSCEGFKGDRMTLVALLDSCGAAGWLQQGCKAVAWIEGSGLERDLFVRTAVVNMYGKCGFVAGAKAAFESIEDRDTVAWNAAVAAFARNGHQLQALETFKLMDLEGIPADEATFVSLAEYHARECCTRSGETEAVLQEVVYGRQLQSTTMVNALLNAHAKSGRIDQARQLFDELQSKELVSWNTMISAYAQRGYTKEAMQVFVSMDLEGVQPDSITFMEVAEACSSKASVDIVAMVEAESRAVNASIKVVNTMVNMYGKCGLVDQAWSKFSESASRDVVTWNAMLGAYAKNGFPFQAWLLFTTMDLEGVQADEVTFLEVLESCSLLADVRRGKLVHACIAESFVTETDSTRNALIAMYSKCGSLDDAARVFDQIPDVKRTQISWNAIVSAYTQFGNGTKARELCRGMELEGSRPSHSTFMSILTALSHKGLLSEAWDFFVSIKADYEAASGMDQFVCLVDVLGRVGELESAEELVNNMPFEPGFIAWACLLAACKTQGDLLRGSRAGENVILLNPDRATAYVLLANIFAAEVSEEIEFVASQASFDTSPSPNQGC